MRGTGMPGRMEPFLHHLKLEQAQPPPGAASSQGGKGPSSRHIPPSALSASWGVFGRGESSGMRMELGGIRRCLLPILTKMPGGIPWMSWPGTGWFTSPKEPLGCDQGVFRAPQTPGSSSHPSTTVLTVLGSTSNTEVYFKGFLCNKLCQKPQLKGGERNHQSLVENV